jgi:hypothetical protein
MHDLDVMCCPYFTYPVFDISVCEKYALLACYTASSGNSLPTFRDNLSIASSRDNNPRILDHLIVEFSTLEDGTNMLSRNVGKELPL